MNHEASIDPDKPTPLWQNFCYGPLVWLFYLFGSLAIHVTWLLHEAIELIHKLLRR